MDAYTIGYIIGVALVGYIGYAMADSRGRNAAGWGIGAALFGLIPIIILAIIGKTDEKKAEEKAKLVEEVKAAM